MGSKMTTGQFFAGAGGGTGIADFRGSAAQVTGYHPGCGAGYPQDDVEGRIFAGRCLAKAVAKNSNATPGEIKRPVERSSANWDKCRLISRRRPAVRR